MDVKIVLFDEVLDHVLRIDRIFRQPQGHLLLIGVSGAGKTTLSRFVAFMNGLSVFQIRVSKIVQLNLFYYTIFYYHQLSDNQFLVFTIYCNFVQLVMNLHLFIKTIAKIILFVYFLRYIINTQAKTLMKI